MKKWDKWIRINHQPCVPLGKDGRRITASAEHIAISRRAAAEGCVLLKNEGNALPLRPNAAVAVFGKAQRDYIPFGGGSGTVSAGYVKCICDGLKEKEAAGKIRICRELMSFYIKNVERQYDDGAIGYFGERLRQVTEPEIPPELLAEAKSFTDTAIITISRFQTEGGDRDGSLDGGDFYLSEQEKTMVKTVSENFRNVIAVINAGAQIDSEWFHSEPSVSAALYCWQGGMEGGAAVADILCGDVDPSGKLSDTFAKKLSDYPSYDSFNESDDFVKYYEDIYTGYRYFETIPEAKDKVNYPFGFGLSYTEFAIDNINAHYEDGKIKVTARVTNAGKKSGREVVQVYYSAPQGKLGKPKYELAAFAKTKTLASGEATTLFMDFPLSLMASYDDIGKIAGSSYVLEKGIYKFFVGNSVRNTVKADYEYAVGEDKVCERLTMQCAPKTLRKRMLSDGSFESLPVFENNVFENHFAENTSAPPEEKTMLIEVLNKKITMDEFVAQLSDEQLIKLTGGQQSIGVADKSHHFGIGDLNEFGIPDIMTSDGPAGVRTWYDTHVTTTAFPTATAIACTWDVELMYEIGVAGAMEIKENNLAIWLTPAMNIHRDPLCGRNFEYFSEDPLLSGKMAAAEVSAIQSTGVGACAKHFCANNKEKNRTGSDSVLSERALREIYLKAFEICVKGSQPYCIMASYNSVNGTKAFGNYDLITGILRGEWNYEGTVISDWGGSVGQVSELKAGCDVKMPIGETEAVSEALKNGEISRREIEVCVKRTLEMILKLE